VRRYLKHQRNLTQEALGWLLADDEPYVDQAEEAKEHEEQAIEERVSLNDARLAAVCAELEASGARSVIDLGCGEGRLLSRLARAKQLTKIVGVDVSPRAL
jgi:2-polyprenyl-3-methyl-5-hydroxy-6-metoxy-1,4-benzoquinol methylase